MNTDLIVIGVGGFTSDVGKTTLMCELLRAFPGWEAIKTTRGHYRSCGKDPQACCVSHLLSEEPLVRSGREETYEAGKDTGRYWDAGAANVHWLIATDNQVEKGIHDALARVQSAGVFVEGNSFSEFVDPNCFVMVRRAGSEKIKSSARRALTKATAIYVSDDETPEGLEPQMTRIKNRIKTDRSVLIRFSSVSSVANAPIFTSSSLETLVEHLRASLVLQRWNQ